MKKNKPYYLAPYFLITIIIAISLLSCGEKKRNCTFYNMQPKLARAGFVKENSYFVYRDSVTGALDSFYTFRYAVDSFCDTHVGSGAWYVQYFVRDSNNVTSYLQAGTEWGKSMSGQFQNFGKVRYLYFPFQPGVELEPLTPIDSLFSTKMIQQHSSLSIRGQTYTEVFELMNRRISKDKADTSYAQMFYSIESGLVKCRIRIKDGDWIILELERSKIIR